MLMSTSPRFVQQTSPGQSLPAPVSTDPHPGKHAWASTWKQRSAARYSVAAQPTNDEFSVGLNHPNAPVDA